MNPGCMFCCFTDRPCQGCRRAQATPLSRPGRKPLNISPRPRLPHRRHRATMAPNATHAPVEMLADSRCGLAPSQARHVSEVQASVSPPGHRRVTSETDIVQRFPFAAGGVDADHFTKTRGHCVNQQLSSCHSCGWKGGLGGSKGRVAERPQAAASSCRNRS